MNCVLCEMTTPDDPAPADFLVGEKPVCRHHTSDLAVKTPLPSANRAETCTRGDEMEKREIDLAAIQADRNNGLSLRALAEKYHIPQTTIRSRLQTAERSASPELAAAIATNGDARAPAKSKPRKSATTVAASNGHAVAHRNGANGDAGELRRLLDTYWQQIPDVECMKILLDRATK